MPERSGIELYAEDEFSKVFKEYDKALDKVEQHSEQTAWRITKAGRQIKAASVAWGTGVEDLTQRMNALSKEADAARARAQDFGAELETGETALGGLSSALTMVSSAVAAVTAVLGTMIAAGLALWSKMAEHVREYVGETESVVEAQERVNAEWDEAAEHLAQALIPLKIELLEIEVKLAEAVGRTAEAFKHLVALVHAPLAAGFEQIKELGRVALDTVRGQAPSFEEAWERISEAGSQKFREVMLDYRDVFEETRKKVEEEEEKFVPDVEPAWSRLADIAQDTFARIRKLQESHNLQMERAAEDAARERARAWRDYERKVAKEISRGEKSLAKITEKYEKDRASTVSDYQKRIAKLEKEGYQEREDAHQDFERQMRHAQERYQLDRIQGARRFQYELGRLIAEGDTLAIEDLRARYEIEQKEAEENQELQQRQARENQTEQIREAGRAAREELAELRTQLTETLAEQESNYREQIEQQRQANAEGLAEMAADFVERRRVQDENLQVQQQRREEDYQRQLRQLGENLGEQLREQDLHYGHAAVLLRQYYGEGGVADAILSEYHARELERIAVTAQAMTQMAQAAAPTLPAVRTPEFHPAFGMQRGGVVTGPATFHVEAGLREAVIPLGGTMQHNFSPLDVNIHGLAGAPQQDINAIAGAIAREMTRQVRAMRRS